MYSVHRKGLINIPNIVQDASLSSTRLHEKPQDRRGIQLFTMNGSLIESNQNKNISQSLFYLKKILKLPKID